LQQVIYHTVTPNEAGQRVDNFLLRIRKGVPKSRIYRSIRKGEVRVNKKRIKAEYKLQLDDTLRIPPLTLDTQTKLPTATQEQCNTIQNALLFENADLIVLNKPSGLGVHGGTHAPLGAIEILRQLRHHETYLELVHRLDLETSGVLLIAKNRTTLQTLHKLLRESHSIQKVYTTLVSGIWEQGERTITHTLKRENNRNQKVQVVSNNESQNDGKEATTTFKPLQTYSNATLLEVQIHTGRMHQIRTQLAHLKHPIIGDHKYGDTKVNRYYQEKFGLNRLFLHASSLTFELEGKIHHYHTPLPEKLEGVLKTL
jgi:23S rRNA pseudouridine955/2504/2580 synthase